MNGSDSMMPNRRAFLKGMALALIVIVAIVAITAVGATDPELAGEQAGALAVAPLLAGVLVGVWARRDSRRWLMLDYVLRFALCSIAAFALTALGRSLIAAVDPGGFDPVPLTQSEKEGLDISGGWATHRSLGFIAPLGGQWTTDSEVQNRINSQLVQVPGTFSWALLSARGDEQAIFYIMKGVDTDEAEFRAMARGMTRGFVKQGVQVHEDVVRWNSRTREYRFAARTRDQGFVKMRCLPPGSKRLVYILCLQTASPDSTGLDAARNHLEIRLR